MHVDAVIVLQWRNTCVFRAEEATRAFKFMREVGAPALTARQAAKWGARSREQRTNDGRSGVNETFRTAVRSMGRVCRRCGGSVERRKMVVA